MVDNTRQVDFGGEDLICRNVYVGATAPGQSTGTNVSTSQGLTQFVVDNVNFNATGDTPITVTLPTGYTRYVVSGLYLSGASASISSSSVGLYTAASGGGTAIVTAATPTVTASADMTNNNTMSMTVINANTESYLVANEGTLYFHVATAQGSAATANVTLQIRPLS
jgi:hypothetical protein